MLLVNERVKNTVQSFELFLEVEQISYSKLEEGTFIYELHYHGKFDSLLYFVEIDAQREHFIFQIAIPLLISDENCLPIVEYITRANLNLRVGNFEFDYDQKHVRYKSCISFYGESLNVGFIRNIMMPAIKMADQYLPGFALIIRFNKSPIAALAKVENN